MRSASLAFFAALTILVGTITDKTTGQPLEGVNVTTTAGKLQLHALTNGQGRFEFRNIADGSYTLHLSSHDVPPQTMQVRVTGKTTHVKLSACSTTLDYNCSGPDMPGGG